MNEYDGVIKTVNLTRVYNEGKKNEFTALKGVDLTITKGEFVSIMGPSGSGKSTLLNLLSCLDTPTRGKVYVEEVDIGELSETERARLRREKFGFIFQQFNLIQSMTTFENIDLPLRFKGVARKDRQKRVNALLDQVGLGNKGGNRPTELSGGEQQRVAIARALANDPKIILADEPTGNLDTKTGEKVMELLSGLNRTENKTVIVVTHDRRIADACDRIIRIHDGGIT